MKLTWLALAVFGLIAAPANAQSQMSDFSFSELKSIYEELDATVQDEARSSTDTPYLDGESAEGLFFTAFGFECKKESEERCRGLELEAEFQLKPGFDTAKVEAVVSYLAVEDYVDGDVLKVSRYVILDGGVSRANVVANIRVFLTLANNTWDKLDEAELLD